MQQPASCNPGAVTPNLQYQHAGLCRSPLEPSLNAELAARAAIDAARRKAVQPKD
jgi:hypothetical protein